MNEQSSLSWASVHQAANRLDADIYLLSGPVEHETVERVLDACRGASRRKNCALILTTYGGSPDAAFLLARFLKRRYAGGRFIDIFSALNVINSQAQSVFELHFSQLIAETGGLVATRTAADIATSMATGLLTPIMAQIDPLRLGSMQRSMSITRKYGELLKPNNGGMVERLISAYPSHSFVIGTRKRRRSSAACASPTKTRRSWNSTCERCCATCTNANACQRRTNTESSRASRPEPPFNRSCLSMNPAHQTDHSRADRQVLEKLISMLQDNANRTVRGFSRTFGQPPAARRPTRSRPQPRPISELVW